MKVADFNYILPEELIAQHPPKIRGQSRLLVLNRRSGKIEHRKYTDLSEFIESGDLVVLNDTKVIKARLVATNSKEQARELLLLEDHHNTDFFHRRVLYRGKVTEGERLLVDNVGVTVNKVLGSGIAEISSETNLLDLAEKKGSVPLPPYMHRKATDEDTDRYQTVFANFPGSVAAPTASLNFTAELRDKIGQQKAEITFLTLHVGLGTFLPIRSEKIEEHNMHSEYFEIPKATAAAIRKAKQNGRKVIAVGTTVARTLEYSAGKILEDGPQDIAGEADIFIYPGYKFNITDTLLTNFHAPKTTVLMLAAAFAGWSNLKMAYEEAIKQKYAFLSYGDSMLIL